jgi:hypothetical protein
MSAVQELRAARDTLTGLVREQRWELRRSEAALAATIEALSLMEHDPVLQAISVATDDLDRSADKSAVYCTAEPAVTSTDVVANTDIEPVAPVVPVERPVRKARQYRSVGRPPTGTWNWQQVCDTIAELQATGSPVIPGLMARFNVPRSAAKNWPGKVAKLGLTPTTAAPTPATARPAVVRTTAGLMCSDCDWWVPLDVGQPAVRLAHHTRSEHGRRPTDTERTTTRVPHEVEP